MNIKCAYACFQIIWLIKRMNKIKDIQQLWPQNVVQNECNNHPWRQLTLVIHMFALMSTNCKLSTCHILEIPESSLLVNFWILLEVRFLKNNNVFHLNLKEWIKNPHLEWVGIRGTAKFAKMSHWRWHWNKSLGSSEAK